MPNCSNKYLNQTKEEIRDYLNNFKKLVKQGKFIIPRNDKRIENKLFIKEYHLNMQKQAEMLLELDVMDFCYSVDNYNTEKERLYIFLKEYKLDNWGKEEKVSVYIKIVIKSDNYSVIVSFHKPNKSIKKLFRNGE